MKSHVRSCPGPVSRRDFMGMGALSLGALSLPDLYRARAAANTPETTSGDDTAVILIWLPGGFPHMETYDMKPDAPAEYRGAFAPIRTNVPGLDVSEHLPLHAKVADRFALIRSISHTFSDHGGGHKHFLTGRAPFQPVGFVNDHPMVGSIVAKVRERRNVGIPNYVAGMDDGRQGVDVFSFGSAYVGPAVHPFVVPGNPLSPTFGVKNVAVPESMAPVMEDRRALLARFDTIRRDIDATGSMSAMDVFNRKAVDLVTSSKTRDAFDLTREPQAVRERYGLHQYGQRALLARRLVESGVSFVTMVMENATPLGQPMPKDCTYNWDCHAVNCNIFTDAAHKLQYYDRAITALIEDLYARGLDKKVMLIVTGEFGHTPRLETGGARPGRDHWPQSMSLLVSGAGMKTGQVIGSTNAKGEHPKDRPLSPQDLWASMYKHLGIDPEASFPDHSGRPMPILPYGSAIKELW